MTRIGFLLLGVALVAGCSNISLGSLVPGRGADRASAPAPAPADATRPQSRPDTGGGEVIERTVVPPVERAVPPQARTAEQFDVTTEAEREVAAAVPKPAGEVFLGTTVASLGDPTQPGFWLKTPLVSAPAQGRVVYPGSGKSSAVDLIPLDGPATGGSRISLAAMRLIEAPLTELPTVEVYKSN
ncbi:hypothetical protein [Pseudaestuariivita atlantica]|nr:hypothetical protein [Pseudaestuariivita atlantica]